MFENDRRARGSSMVLVALLMVPLMGFAALAIDVGMLYTARTQCQNAADAGALAGAGYMLTLNNLNGGAANSIKAKAVEFANYNQVLSTPVIILPSDVTVDFNLKRCTVCVPRTEARGNAVQTFFARVLLRNSVDVSACATAEIANARSSNCLKPWALPDAFVDGNGNGAYDAGEYYQQGVTSFGTNYRQNGFDVGIQIIVKQADPSAAIAPGQFFPIDLPIDGVDTGAARYQNNIATCEPAPVKIGDTLYT